MQINSLRDLLSGFKPVEQHKPSLPATKRTPAPQSNKVVGRPTRTPINRQSALLLSPIRSWLSQPLPDQKLPTKEQKAIDELTASLKTERNAHAMTRDSLGHARDELRQAKSLLSALQDEIRRLRSDIRQKDNLLQQLEDLRL